MKDLIKQIDLLAFEMENESAELWILKDRKVNEYMLPVSHIGAGRTFGELALQVNKKNPHKVPQRAASVTCILPCKFATMGKKDYQAILAKID
jgi:hypothetical protein